MYSLLNRTAPNFTTSVVMGDNTINDQFDFHQAIEGKYAVLFFYPLDFTFVCPTELIALNQHYQELQKQGVEVFAVSIDSAFSHLAWKNTPVNKGGIGNVHFPMIADVSHNITRTYGAEHPEAHVAYRATYIIDPNKTVRTMTLHDLPIGRNMGELIRVIDALKYHEQHGEVCPANWEKGQPAMQPTQQGVQQYLTNQEKEDTSS
jgi:peroxiredoxin 2/4